MIGGNMDIVCIVIGMKGPRNIWMAMKLYGLIEVVFWYHSTIRSVQRSLQYYVGDY